MGLIEKPLTKTQPRNAPGARLIVDDLEMLLDKTTGSLDSDESANLEKILSDLRHHVARISGDY